jgi:hypothetical protein
LKGDNEKGVKFYDAIRTGACEFQAGRQVGTEV